MDNSKHSDEAEKLLAELSARKGEGEGEPKSTVSIFYLQPEEVNTLSHQAKRGDGEAGFRLFLYYKLSNYDEEKSSQWLK
ncbi:TPA: sel1 repeat family protein, partial [Escherichia coli]|nr:sel1 repeat family protein [Escherichia coli]HDW9431830.1 sel1 repeat family protein [Escherichia coli]